MTKRVFVGICLSFVALCCGGQGPIKPTSQAMGEDTKVVDNPTKPFFTQHCQGCHEGTKPKGNFRLDTLASDFGAKANREQWQTVLEQIKSGAMPPERNRVPLPKKRRP